MEKIKAFFRWFLILAVILFGIGLFLGLKLNYSTGVRAGQVIKFSNKGVIFKTYEGQLHAGGFSDDGDLNASIFTFSVRKNREDIIENLQEAMNQGYRVKLKYEYKYVKFFFLGDTRYFITKVEKVRADG